MDSAPFVASKAESSGLVRCNRPMQMVKKNRQKILEDTTALICTYITGSYIYIYTYTHILYYNLIDQALNDKTWFYICIYIIISYIYAAHAYGHTCTDNARFNLPSGLAYVRQPRRYWWQMLELPRPERQGCEDTTVVALGMLCELSQK